MPRCRLLVAQSVPLNELRAETRRTAAKMGGPFPDIAGLIRAVHVEKLLQYDIQRRREAR